MKKQNSKLLTTCGIACLLSIANLANAADAVQTLDQGYENASKVEQAKCASKGKCGTGNCGAKNKKASNAKCGANKSSQANCSASKVNGANCAASHSAP